VADAYIAVEVETDAVMLADAAIDRLKARWPGYEPNDGDLEVVMIEELAPMAQNAAEKTVRVPPYVLRTVGQRLHGIPYDDAQPARGTLTVTFTDVAPHVLKAGSEFDVDGVAFAVDVDTPNAGALVVPGVPITAKVDGTVGNDLVGDTVDRVSALSFVAGATLDAPTSDGVDAEGDDAYQDKVARQLALRAKTLVHPRDFELDALDTPGIGRARAVVTVAAKHMDVFVTQEDGTAVPAPVKAALAADYADNVASNWTLAVVDPTYTAVAGTFRVHPLPGVDVADLLARCTAAIDAYLSPAGFGVPKSSGDSGAALARTLWLGTNVVRRLKLVDVLGDVDGVDYVDDVTITGSDVNGNLTLAGTVALPTPGAWVGTTV
jgi:hypothetical protein